MKTETYKLYSRDFWIFLPNTIKIDIYNFELYRFKVAPFFGTQCMPFSGQQHQVQFDFNAAVLVGKITSSEAVVRMADRRSSDHLISYMPFHIVGPFERSLFRTAFMDLNLYWIKGALALFVLVSGTCARLSCILSFRVHVKLFYRIVSYRLYLQPFSRYCALIV